MAYYGYRRGRKQSVGVKIEGVTFRKGRTIHEDRVNIVLVSPVGRCEDSFGCCREKFGLRAFFVGTAILHGEKLSVGDELFGDMLRRAHAEFRLQYGNIKREKFRADIHG